MVTSGDMLGHRLYILVMSHSSFCCLLSNLNFKLLKSAMHAYLCVLGCAVRENPIMAENEWDTWHVWLFLSVGSLCGSSVLTRRHRAQKRSLQPLIFIAFALPTAKMMLQSQLLHLLLPWCLYCSGRCLPLPLRCSPPQRRPSPPLPALFISSLIVLSTYIPTRSTYFLGLSAITWREVQYSTGPPTSPNTLPAIM